MNGSTRARNAASLINQPNTMGGVKKAGLAPTVGLIASVSNVYRKKLGCVCNASKMFISKARAPGCSVGCVAGVVYR